MFEKLSPKSIKVVMVAQEEARRLLNSFVLPEHILLAILKEDNSIANKLLIERGLTYENIYEKIQDKENEKPKLIRLEMQFSPTTKHAVEVASDEAERLNEDLVQPEHLLMGIINIGENTVTEILKESGINLSRIRWHLLRLREQNESSEDNDEIEVNEFNNIALTTDLTYKIEQKEIEPVIELSKYIEETISSLNLYEQQFPLIIGEKGVGKKSLIIGLTQYLMDGKIYKELQNYRVLEFSFYQLFYESDNNEQAVQKFKQLTNEINNARDVILIIKDFSIVLENESNKNILYILISFLKNTNKNIIFVENIRKYKNFIIKSDLNPFFIPIVLNESDNDKTYEILEYKSIKMQKYYDIAIEENILSEIINISKKHNPHQYYPDVAVRMLDLLLSKKKFSKSINQSKIREIEKSLRSLKDKRDEYINNNDFEKLEQIRKKAQDYEEEIKQLNVNVSANIKPTLTLRDVQLILKKNGFEGDI